MIGYEFCSRSHCTVFAFSRLNSSSRCFLALWLTTRNQPWILLWCQSLSRVWLFRTPLTVVSQAPLPMELPRQESWSGGVPFPSPGDLLGPGIKPSCVSLHWQVDSLRLKPPGKPVTLPEDPLGYECFQDFPLSLAVRLWCVAEWILWVRPTWSVLNFLDV